MWALYSWSTKLKLPTLSLVEEFKLGKAWFFQMLHDSRISRDSRDPLVKNVQPFVITGWKWKTKIAVENAESALKMKEIVGTVENGRASLGLHRLRLWSKESTINKRKMLSEEIHHLEKVRCIATALGQRKQGTWTKWESHEAILSTWNPRN